MYHIILQVPNVDHSDSHCIPEEQYWRKLKHARNSTLSLSVVIVVVKIFHKFHDDDTVNSNDDDKTAILLFLKAFKLFSQQFWLF